MNSDNDLRIEVLERQVLTGPNLYAHFPCIKLKVDIHGFEERPTNTLEGFHDRLAAALPGIIEHRCSEGVRGGFLMRVQEGTWIGHVLEHVTLELQSRAGLDVGFGRVRSAGPEGVYNVVYEMVQRESGVLAGQIALELVQALVAGSEYPVGDRIAELRRVHDRNALGPSTSSIVDAAKKRGIPCIRLDAMNLVQLGYGNAAQRIRATIASTTRFIGVEIAGDKDLTKALLGSHGIPVPKGEMLRDVEDAVDVANRIGYPVVVKPLDASQGRGIMTNIRTEEELRSAFEEAKKYRKQVIVERHLEGRDFRLLVVNHKFVAAAERVPAHVTGDGQHTIEELVAITNLDPRRGDSHENVLTKIKLDPSSDRLLELRGMTRESIPMRGQRVMLKTTANLSTGGTAVDVTALVHPDNVRLAERISRLVDLDIAGIDIVAPSIDRPVAETGGGIVEVNAAPGFRMHTAPTEGQPQPVGEAVVDMLFPHGSNGRIPLIAITGTNGKTTTARLCAHIAREAAHKVGLTTSDGIYIDGELIERGDTTGPVSARTVLTDPAVDFAVLETARGGILRAGIAYDYANTAIVTNIAADHLGLRDVHTLEDLAEVKALVLERILPGGVGIVNADDAMYERLRGHIKERVALFSLKPDNEHVSRHTADGGLAAVVDENGTIVIHDGGEARPICNIKDVPLTFGGLAAFNVANAVAAALAAYATGIAAEHICAGLQSFVPSEETTPGRVNFMTIGTTDFVVDYAHNPHGLEALLAFLSSIPKYKRLIAVFGLPGDRRDADMRQSTAVIAKYCDHVIIREDFDLRGREKGEVPALIATALHESGVPRERVEEVHVEDAAAEHAVHIARRDDLVVFIADKPALAMKFLRKLQQQMALAPAAGAR